MKSHTEILVVAEDLTEEQYTALLVTLQKMKEAQPAITVVQGKFERTK